MIVWFWYCYRSCVRLQDLQCKCHGKWAMGHCWEHSRVSRLLLFLCLYVIVIVFFCYYQCFIFSCIVSHGVSWRVNHGSPLAACENTCECHKSVLYNENIWKCLEYSLLYVHQEYLRVSRVFCTTRTFDSVLSTACSTRRTLASTACCMYIVHREHSSGVTAAGDPKMRHYCWTGTELICQSPSAERDRANIAALKRRGKSRGVEIVKCSGCSAQWKDQTPGAGCCSDLTRLPIVKY